MKKELREEIDRFNRIYDKYFFKCWGVRIIWKHNVWGGIDCYTIEKKKKWRFHKRKSVKICTHNWKLKDYHFGSKEEAFERLDKAPVEATVVYDDIDLIITD